ncbi:helix-turn-helix domain-containing protein [Flexivirga sp. ID2601S]|uniref:Helix-turn-helix domain-containing protein n=1 Tax=Flexivirga aerilata TaxID=1656889 RepID=A0A849AKW7_9MICO|nr:helix-turn-helix domain-containing protein [Flexivirga aerilata]NNG41009.1 helix-turn-helix domain-containing protein [Flexivirga aerilata]
MRQKVAVLLQPGSTMFETGIPGEALGYDWGEGALYDVQVHAETAVALAGGVVVQPTAPLDEAVEAHTLIVPSTGDLTGPFDPQVLELLRLAHARGKRVVSICTGAFVLAAAGLLAHRSATTHWRRCGLLRSMYPDTLVLPDKLYVDDGVITGAGSTAGIDLCLYLIRQDHGISAANAVARRLVVSAYRDGGQAQFAGPEPLHSDADWLANLSAWVHDRIEVSIGVKDLARAAGMSTRTLNRRFENEVGASPGRWLNGLRTDHARRLLESTAIPVDVISARCGYASATTFRAAFRRVVGSSPSHYRRERRHSPAAGPA